MRSVIFLRAALGPAAVAQPAIDLGSAWGALGDALGFGVLNPPFTPYEARARCRLRMLAERSATSRGCCDPWHACMHVSTHTRQTVMVQELECRLPQV